MRDIFSNVIMILARPRLGVGCGPSSRGSILRLVHRLSSPCVQEEQRSLCIHPLGGAMTRLLSHLLVPPHVAAGLQRNPGRHRGVLQDKDSVNLCQIHAGGKSTLPMP